MAAPSLFDGVSRACREVGLPSIGLLGLVWYIGITYGELEAGLTYVVLTGAILLGTYVATKYWNSRYTLGFAVTGLAMWVGVPALAPFLVPSPFATIGQGLVLVFLVLTAWRVTDKLGRR